MADAKEVSEVSAWSRTVSFALRVTGGRVFVQNANSDNTDISSIELKCWWSPSLSESFDTTVRIGGDKHQSYRQSDDELQALKEGEDDEIGWDLIDCPIMLSLEKVDENWITESSNRNDGKPTFGKLKYYRPSKVNEDYVDRQRAVITSWVAIGHGNFELIRSCLVANETPDFELLLAVEFPHGSIDSNWTDRKVYWDGEGSLSITGASIVWKRGDWDSNADQEHHISQDPEHDDLVPAVENYDILVAAKRLEGIVARLATPLWIAVAIMIIATILAL